MNKNTELIKKYISGNDIEEEVSKIREEINLMYNQELLCTCMMISKEAYNTINNLLREPEYDGANLIIRFYCTDNSDESEDGSYKRYIQCTIEDDDCVDVDDTKFEYLRNLCFDNISSINIETKDWQDLDVEFEVNNKNIKSLEENILKGFLDSEDLIVYNKIKLEESLQEQSHNKKTTKRKSI